MVDRLNFHYQQMLKARFGTTASVVRDNEPLPPATPLQTPGLMTIEEGRTALSRAARRSIELPLIAHDIAPESRDK
jgi:hypothetical protein